MIDSLIAALRGLQFEPTAEEVADAVWLALHMSPSFQDSTSRTKVADTADKRDEQPAAQPPPQTSGASNSEGNTLQPEAADSQTPSGARKGRIYPPTPARAKQEVSGGATPLRSPAAQALPGALELNRALRPLMRREPSRRMTVFDEEATARRIAEEGIWVPVLRPAPARWLDVVLIVDDSASMRIWRQTVVEFQRLLERQGAFRDVRVWRLKTDSQGGQASLYAGERMTARNPKELIDPAGRRLLLLLTDCVSEAWEGQYLPGLLEQLGKRNHVAIVQMLPQRLWSQTALSGADFFQVRAPSVGAPNARLKPSTQTPPLERWPNGALLPLLTLERVPSAAWAKALVASGGASVPAVFLETSADEEAERITDNRVEARTAKDRVRYFQANASATAYKLALSLAAAPLTLPIMRLVQRAVLPDSRQVHLAEVFLGGLLRQVAPDDEVHDPETVEYDFQPGVRELLLASALVPDSIQILSLVSNYLKGRFGQSLDFMALLEHPTAAGGVAIGELNQPFALVAAKILRQLGGRYARIAGMMELRAEGGTGAPASLDEPNPVPEPIVHTLSVPPGLKLQRTLRAHAETVGKMAWSPDGRWLAVPSADATICVWDTVSGKLHITLRGHGGRVTSVAWGMAAQSPLLASGSDDGTVNLWRPSDEHAYRTVSYGAEISSLTISPDGYWCAAGATDNLIRIWDTENGSLRRTLRGHTGRITSLEWSPDGRLLASASEYDSQVLLWDITGSEPVRLMPKPISNVLSLAWSPDGQTLAAGHADGSIWIWDATQARWTATFEAHTDIVNSLSFSADGQLLASRSHDGTVRLWRTETHEVAATLTEQKPHFYITGIAFHPGAPVLVTLGESDRAIRIWELDLDTLLGSTQAPQSVSYANAKVVLLGDSGVGKTGLGIRLAQGIWQPTQSTHGMNVWTLHSEPEREVMLWDFAGQDEYRLVHQLFLNETNVALLLFDSMRSQDTFEGIGYWEKALDSAVPGGVQKILVAARTDIGGLRMTPREIEAYCKEHGYISYVAVSAETNEGCPDLRAAILAAIPWDRLPRTSSPEVFKRIKDFLAAVRQGERVLVREADLRAEFNALVGEGGQPTEIEFRTVIGHVETAGLIKRLSLGDFVLLKPELLNGYASYIIDAARRHPDGLGAVRKADVLEGRIRLWDDGRLSDVDKIFLLHATVEMFLRLGLALEQDDNLVFPSKFNRQMPPLEESQFVEVEFSFAGAIESLYTTLVVKLYHGGVFRLEKLWKNAAEFLTGDGRVCGFQLSNSGDGAGTLKLFYAEGVGDSDKALFHKIVADHFEEKRVEMRRERLYRCPNCREPVRDRQAVKRALARGVQEIPCLYCFQPIPLLDALEALSRDDKKFLEQIAKMEVRAEASMERGGELVAASAELRTDNFKQWAGGVGVATIAIVFTDVLNSTVLNMEMGDEHWRQVREAHFKQARTLVTQGQGYLIKTIGDSVMAAFHSAADALDFALVLRRQSGHESVRIRAGIHIGAVEVEAGDAFGQHVNMASRIVGKAKQDNRIWMSAQVKEDIERLRAARHSQLSWTEHAGEELKGFPQKCTLWSVEPRAENGESKYNRVWNELERAHREGTSIKGRIIERVKGGLRVDVDGVDAFLPGSQIDSRPVRNLESFRGQEIEAKVIKLNRKRSNIVLSRKAVLDEQSKRRKDETLDNLEEGIIVDGQIKSLTDYGAFVDVGGIDGLLHVVDMSWGRLQNPAELFKVGETVQVKVLKFDRERERISLGYKQLLPDPWESVEERYLLGGRVVGTAASVTDYGAFIELEPGVEGLVHVSEMSWSKRMKHPSKLVNVGDTVEAEVLGVDPKARRISLGMKQMQPNPSDPLVERYQIGARVKGRVRDLMDFGAFIEIEEGVEGFLHVNDLSLSKRIKHPGEVLKKGQEIDAVVTNIDAENRRLSLSTKDVATLPWDKFTREHRAGDVVRGRITRLANFGVFVELADGLEGTCHVSELSEERVYKPEEIAQIGQEMAFRILRIDPESGSIDLSASAAKSDETSVDTEGYSTGANGNTLSLAELAAAFSNLHRRPTLAELQTYLRRTKVSDAELRPYVNFRPGTYVRTRVMKNEHVELLVLCWKPGQYTSILDYNGSYSVIHVLKGWMHKTIYDYDESRGLREGESRAWERDRVIITDIPDIQRVGNPEGSGQDLITLHCYSPPLAVINTYQLNSTEVDTLQPKPERLDTDTTRENSGL